MDQQNIKTAMTATTGMSRHQFVHGQTIHHWSGYGDGHVDKNTIVERILNHAAYKDIKSNIINRECLIIYDIGLMSLKTFESVEFICRNVHKSDIYFGGIQIIGSGSFKQLPPVPSFSDPGLYCFQSPCFDAVFPHHMFLDEVICQNEADLIAAINELCDGVPSMETKELMKSLQRPLPQDLQSKAIYIFGTNFDVNFHNYEKLSKLPGGMKIYNANDRGPAKYLHTCNAPRVLGIKINAKILVIHNLPNV